MVEQNKAAVEAVESENFEMAIPVVIQQKAALHAIAIGLLDMGNTPNKKHVKNIAKRLKREVMNQTGDKAGAKELLEQNISSVIATLVGIRKDPAIKVESRKRMINYVREDWFRAFTIGTTKLGLGG